MTPIYLELFLQLGVPEYNLLISAWEDEGSLKMELTRKLRIASREMVNEIINEQIEQKLINDEVKL